MTSRIYRDVHPVLYRELADHAEHRGLTVPAFLEDLAIAYASNFHPDGTRRETPLRIPRGWQAQPEEPVEVYAGKARRPRKTQPAGPRRHYLDDPDRAAQFREWCAAGFSNAALAAQYGKAAQTIANWREYLGIPAAGTALAEQIGA